PQDDRQTLAGALAQSGIRLEQALYIQRDRRDGIVDVVCDSTGHLTKRTQPLLLQRRLLRLPKFRGALRNLPLQLRLPGSPQPTEVYVSPHPSQQLAGRERLYQVIVRAGIEALHSRLFTGARRKKNDGQRASPLVGTQGPDKR